MDCPQLVEFLRREPGRAAPEPTRRGHRSIDKPAGITSHDVVAGVRRRLGKGVKVGHAGTLDPFATGLLLVLVGRATRVQRFLMALPKRYETVARLGWTSTTGDRDGELAPGRTPAEPLALPTGRLHGGAPPGRLAQAAAEGRAPDGRVPVRRRVAARGPPVLIGGKSMGGRVASLVADDLYAAGRIAGLVCLGYPFHPPNKPEQLRTAHLERLACPALIVQGERDPFGGRAEVEGYPCQPHPLALGKRRRSRSRSPRRLGLHPQGQPRRRRRCGRGVCARNGAMRGGRRRLSTPLPRTGCGPRQALRQQEHRRQDDGGG